MLLHRTRHQALLPEEIGAYVVAHLLQMFGQLRTGAVLRRIDQLRNILLRGYPDRKMLFSALKRKS